MLLGVRQALVDGTWVPGDIEVLDGLVARVGVDPAPDAAGLAAPGFVDLHINGIAGVDFLHTDADGYARAEAALARTGVVAYRPTFITAPREDTLAALAVVAGLPHLGGAAGPDAAPASEGRGPAWEGRASAREGHGPAPEDRAPAPEDHGPAPEDHGLAPEGRGSAPNVGVPARQGDSGTDGAARPERLGVHLEGPFLSPRWPGAHDPADLRAVDDALVDELLAAGPVTHMTLAPELDGGPGLVRRLADAGVLVSVGHTDADAPAAYAAFDAGARTLTHLHNAHRRWTARDPGPAGAALVRPDVVIQLIADGVHLAPETVLTTFRAAPGRVALVTDAIEAAGLPDGPYRLGDRHVTVADGAARLADGTLAGSVATMDAAVRCAVASGVDPADALLAASAVPAGLLGRDDLGVLHVGAPANLVVCDDDLRVRRTLIRGLAATSA